MFFFAACARALSLSFTMWEKRASHHSSSIFCPSPTRPTYPHAVTRRTHADRFLDQFTERVDLNTRAYFAWVYTIRWLGFRLDVVVAMVLMATCFFSVAAKEYSNSIGGFHF